MDDKNPIKSTIERDASSTGRLQTLKLPRDLTLGISKPKKQFAPNVNVTRAKHRAQPKEPERKLEEKAKATPEKDRPSKSKQPRFIQTEGIFSHGDQHVPQRSFERRSGYSSARPSSSFSASRTARSSHSTNVGDSVKTELEEDDDSESDEDDKEIFHMVEQDYVVRQDDHSNLDVTAVKKEEEVESEQAKTHPFSDAANYSDEAPHISLVKLPPTYPGRVYNANKTDYSLSRFADLPDGQIGTLIVRKSGKMELKMGNVPFKLKPHFDNANKEELVIIKSKDAEPSETTGPSEETERPITVLGNLVNRFILSVDFEAILSDEE